MAEESARVLSYAIRGRVVAKYLCLLALMLAVLTLVPLLVALLESNWSLVYHYVVVCVFLFLIGGLYTRLPVPARVQDNEALALTALAFILAPMLMTWPMMAENIPTMDALFESVSGVTTTGLSTLGSVEQRPATFLFTRAWMQWYGGLGIIVLSAVLLMGHGIATRRLMFPEDSSDNLPTTARIHARHTLIIYVVLTLTGIVVVWAQTGSGFPAMLNVLSAVSTGGFSPFDASLAALPSRWAAITIMVVCVLSAVSLPLYWHVVHAGARNALRELVADPELRALLVAGLLVGSLLAWLGWLQGRGFDAYHSFMIGVSAQTTAGFAASSVTQLDSASKLVLIISMLIGGSIGSSAGGFKLFRLLILLRILQLIMRRAGMPPHAIITSSLAGQRLEDIDVIRALRLILLFVIVIVISWLPFLVMGYNPLDALFEVVSACGTVGLSTGITRPDLEPLLKGVLCFDMLAGRVEIIALLILFYPRSWFGQKGEI